MAKDGESASITCPHCGVDHPDSWSHCPNSGRPLHAGPALTGRVVAGRYEILGLLGEGGMGAVYEAKHLQLGRKVAIKRLHPELAKDESAVRRFQREARAAGTIGHDHIVDVLDLGYAEDGAPYLAMELLVGESLADRLRRAGRLDPRRAARVAGEMLSALEAVHGRGVIHRDLKPDNVFLCRLGGRRDFVKVLDFGISKVRGVAGGETEGLTRTGAMMGTPHYMSAEQAQGRKDLDHRVDIYAIGVILYESLAGELPFQGGNYHALLQAILSGRRKPLLDVAPNVSPGLAAVIDKAMASNRDERYPDAHSMHAALRPFGAEAPHSPSTTRSPAVGDAPTARMDSDLRADRLAELGRPITDEVPIGTTSMTPPVSPAPTPARFVAHSADYARDPFESIRPSAKRASIEPAAAAETSPGWAPSTPFPSDDSHVKASLLLAIEVAVDEVHGRGSTRALIESHVRLQKEWPVQLLSIARLPFWVLETFLDALLERFGGGLDSIREYGRRATGSERMGTHRRLLEGAPTETIIKRLGTFYAAYLTAGRLRPHRLEARRWCLDLEEAEVSEAFLALLSGVCEHVFERAGVTNAESQIVACAANGDSVRNAIEMSW
ncbi:MAG: protein kinase [Deltaproteobacteria bacterium]|nr:protein kinase [Deltaproteobacteria bacterium]